MSRCQHIGKQLAAFCRVRSIEIRKCKTNDERFGTVNSYPLTAWEAFISQETEENHAIRMIARCEVIRITTAVPSTTKAPTSIAVPVKQFRHITTLKGRQKIEKADLLLRHD